MTNRYRTLRKKLKELKAEILYLFSLPPRGYNDDDEDVNNSKPPLYNHQQVSEDIQQRFLFTKKLLSAEIASHPSKEPRHLRHISKRLAELESAFRRWDDHRRRFSDGGRMGEDDATTVWSRDDDDDEEEEEDSCGKDECENNMRRVLGGGSGRVGEDRSLNFPEGLVDVNVEQDTRLQKKAAAVSTNTTSDDDDDDEEESNVEEEQKLDGTGERSISNGGYSYWGGLISGMIFGAMLLGSFMFRFSTAPHDFLIPT